MTWIRLSRPARVTHAKRTGRQERNHHDRHRRHGGETIRRRGDPVHPTHPRLRACRDETARPAQGHDRRIPGRRVERRVAELERRRTLDQAEIIRLKRENHGRQTENGELNQRLTMLQEQNKKLEYQASNPYEHIGVDMQNMVNGAKAERKAILDKAETEAKTILARRTPKPRP